MTFYHCFMNMFLGPPYQPCPRLIGKSQPPITTVTMKRARGAYIYSSVNNIFTLILSPPNKSLSHSPTFRLSSICVLTLSITSEILHFLGGRFFSGLAATQFVFMWQNLVFKVIKCLIHCVCILLSRYLFQHNRLTLSSNILSDGL